MRLLAPLALTSLLVAGPIRATPTPAAPVAAPAQAAAPPAPAAAPTPPAGWQAAGADLPAATCSVDMPRMPLKSGVIVMLKRPEIFPRPSVDCGHGTRLVPMPATQDTLVRVEGPPVEVGWRARLHASARGLATVVDVDVPPLRPAETEAAPDDATPQPIAPSPSLREYAMPRWREDPSRLRGGATSFTEPEPEPVPPILTAVGVDSVEADGPLVSTDTGWMRLGIDLNPAQLQWYRMGATEIRGLPGRVIVAPVPRHPRAVLELFAVQDKDLSITSLGRPALAGGSWRQEVSDVRERTGALEAILIERDMAPKGATSGPTWGAIARREAAGWVERTRFPLPDGVTSGSVRFDPASEGRVLLVATGSTWARALP